MTAEEFIQGYMYANFRAEGSYFSYHSYGKLFVASDQGTIEKKALEYLESVKATIDPLIMEFKERAQNDT